MGLRSWTRYRVTLVAGQAQTYEPRKPTTNALYIINNNSADVLVGPTSDVVNDPQATVKSKSNGPVPLSAPGEVMYLYSASAMTLTVVEMTTDDLSVVFAMQVVVSDISSAVDVSDRAGRALGQVSVTGSNFEGTLDAAAPSKAVQIGGYSAGTLRAISVDGSGRPQVNVTQIGGQAAAVVNTGQLVVTLKNSSGTEVSLTSSTADGITINSMGVKGQGYRFNGATWDMERGNTEGTLLTSVARTVSASSPTQTNHNARGVWVTLDVTANPGGAETLTVYIRKANRLGGSVATNMVQFPAIAAATNGVYRYFFYPDAVETVAMANQEVQGLGLPRTWAGLVEHSAAGSWTYELTYEYVL